MIGHRKVLMDVMEHLDWGEIFLFFDQKEKKKKNCDTHENKGIKLPNVLF